MVITKESISEQSNSGRGYATVCSRGEGGLIYVNLVAVVTVGPKRETSHLTNVSKYFPDQPRE